MEIKALELLAFKTGPLDEKDLQLLARRDEIVAKFNADMDAAIQKIREVNSHRNSIR